MAKIYVVTKAGSEYDDEYYTMHDEGEGTPVKAYSTKEAAEKSRDERTIEWFKSENIFDYSSDIEDLLRDSTHELFEVTGITEEEYKEARNNWDFDNISRKINENAEKVVNLFWMVPYQVTEVELD